MLQPGRTTLFQGLLEPEPAFIVDIMVEIEVNAGGRVGEETPARLTERVAVSVGVDKHSADAKAGLEHDLDGIGAETRGLHNLVLRQTLVIVAQEVEDAELFHQTADLKDDGAEGYPLGFFLGLSGSESFAAVDFFEFGIEIHTSYLLVLNSFQD